MKKLKENWRILLLLAWNNFWNNSKKTTYDLAKESILHLLHKELTIQESLNLYKDISEVFIAKMRERSLEVKKENELLDKFLSVF